MGDNILYSRQYMDVIKLMLHEKFTTHSAGANGRLIHLWTTG